MTRPVAALFVLSALASSAIGKGVWIDVPFVRQTDRACGAATASMLLRYWRGAGFAVKNADLDLESLHQRIYSQSARGTWGSDLARLLEESGLKVFVFEGDYRDLEKHIAAGRPLAVCLDPPRGNFLHFAVVVGLEPEAVLVNDPARRKLTRYGREEFLAAWQAASSWTLLAVPETP